PAARRKGGADAWAYRGPRRAALALQGSRPMSSAHRYLDVLDRVAEAHANAKSAKSAKSGPRTFSEAEQNAQKAQNSLAQRLLSVLAALEARCPDRVPAERWQQAVADGRRPMTACGQESAPANLLTISAGCSMSRCLRRECDSLDDLQ